MSLNTGPAIYFHRDHNYSLLLIQAGQFSVTGEVMHTPRTGKLLNHLYTGNP